MRNNLSINRIHDVSEEFNRVFSTWAVTREIFDVKFTPIKYTVNELAEDDYIKIGINQIVKRDFFTEQTGRTYYDHLGIGSNYGKSVAFGEIRYILNNFIIDNDNVIILNDDNINKYLTRYINKDEEIKDLVILSSPMGIHTFWGDNKHIIVNNKSLWAYINNIPLYWTPAIPKNTYYVFYKNIGKIMIKKSATIDVSEIEKTEYESIIKSIPTMTKDMLLDMIRVRCNEVIKFQLNASAT